MTRNMKKNAYYVHNWVTSLYNRDGHNIVNQLYVNWENNEM